MQFGTFTDERCHRDLSPSGKVFQLLHLGFRKLNLCANRTNLPGEKGVCITFPAMINNKEPIFVCIIDRAL